MTSKTLFAAVPAPSAGSRLPWIYAAKTTLSALLALLIAFTFNLGQPQWTLLTVFIVSQPRRDGPVFAKSFFRIIGTVVGAVMALLLVAVAAQERTLFLGALAAWIGICTFGSQYAQSWMAYGFVLSGYTAAIVGIPGALDPGNAFYIAVARVTEVSLGILVAATVAHLVLPDSIAAVLRQTIADMRIKLGDYAIAVLCGDGTAAQRAELLGRAAAIEDLCRSAIFEDQEIRGARHRIAHLNGALIPVVGSAQLLVSRMQALPPAAGSPRAELDGAVAEATAAIRAWQAGTIDAAGLGQRLRRAQSKMTSAPPLTESPPFGEDEIARQSPWPGALEDFFAALIAYADADQALASGRPLPVPQLRITRPNDVAAAALTGLRAVLAVALAGSFWILTDWPHGSTATVLAALATSRLATMGHAVPLAIATALIFSLVTIPAFIVVDVLLPLASGFPMFALVVAPMLFLCALLMANEKTMVIGFMSALLFASVGAFQNRMVYDPVSLVNTAIAAVFAVVLTMVLWAALAPETPDAVRRRFVRAARKALAPMIAGDCSIALPKFEGAMGGALAQFRTGLAPDRVHDAASFEAGMTLLGAGRELILLRADRTSLSARRSERSALSYLRSGFQVSILRCLSELQRNPLDLAALRASVREVALLQDQLALCSVLEIRIKQLEDLQNVA